MAPEKIQGCFRFKDFSRPFKRYIAGVIGTRSSGEKKGDPSKYF